MFVDFTSQETRDHWKEMLKEHVLEYGTSSVWNDNCEYDSMVDKDCRCYFEGKGGTIGQLKSVMSNIMCHISNEAIHETLTIPVLMWYVVPDMPESRDMHRPGQATT